MLFTIHYNTCISLLTCVCNVPNHGVCTVPDVMVGVITGEMSWPAVTVRNDSRGFLG